MIGWDRLIRIFCLHPGLLVGLWKVRLESLPAWCHLPPNSTFTHHCAGCQMWGPCECPLTWKPVLRSYRLHFSSKMTLCSVEATLLFCCPGLQATCSCLHVFVRILSSTSWESPPFSSSQYMLCSPPLISCVGQSVSYSVFNPGGTCVSDPKHVMLNVICPSGYSVWKLLLSHLMRFPFSWGEAVGQFPPLGLLSRQAL